jgi:hypothetical protein
LSDEMIRSIQILVGKFGPLLGGHRDAPGAATACPGRNLYARMSDLARPLVVLPEPQVPIVPVEPSPVSVAPIEPKPVPIAPMRPNPVPVVPVRKSPVPDLREGWIRHLARLRKLRP